MILEKKEIIKLMTGGLIYAFSSSALQASQICNDHIVSSTPIKNFILYKSGVALDKSTGLMWKRCPNDMSWSEKDQKCSVITDNNGKIYSEENWQKALESVTKLNQNSGFAGYQDWRLPNLKELLTIIEKKCINPAYNQTLFPNVYLGSTVTRYFWTSTPAGSDQVWMVSEDGGSIIKRNRDSGVNSPHSIIERVLLVRDAKDDTDKYIDGVQGK